jgi:hypothetical protein
MINQHKEMAMGKKTQQGAATPRKKPQEGGCGCGGTVKKGKKK